GLPRIDERASDGGDQQIMKVVIIPCSGIGKTYGTVSREAAYEVTQEIRREQTVLVPLSLLVLGDEAARAAVAGSPVITIDGCKLGCAKKMAQESGGTIAQDVAVLDVYRRYRQFKPQGIAELNEGGKQLARAMAEEIGEVVDSLGRGEEGGQNA
ncbi:MAG: putative zinc-binding protein, partial [Bacteroidota bacterium]